MIYPINSMAVFVYVCRNKVRIDSFPMPVFNKLLDQGLKHKKFWNFGIKDGIFDVLFK